MSSEIHSPEVTCLDLQANVSVKDPDIVQWWTQAFIAWRQGDAQATGTSSSPTSVQAGMAPTCKR